MHCNHLERHRQVRFDPRVITKYTGCVPRIVFQLPGTVITIHPDAYHAVANVGDTGNIATNIVLPTTKLTFPYRCQCGWQDELCDEWRAEHDAYQPEVKNNFNVVVEQWNKEDGEIPLSNFRPPP